MDTHFIFALSQRPLLQSNRYFHRNFVSKVKNAIYNLLYLCKINLLQLEEMFKEADLNHDGKISIDGMKIVFSNLNFVTGFQN